MSIIPSPLKKRLSTSGDTKRVLHIFSGAKGNERLHKLYTGEGWEEIRMDPFPAHAPDITGSWEELQHVPDTCMDAIWASHCIQRISPIDLTRILEQCLRVLKLGGSMLVTTPDLLSVSKAIWEGKLPTESVHRIGQPIITPIDLLYGAFRDVPGPVPLIHKNAFTAPSLGLAFKKAGFFNIEIKRSDDFVLWGIAHKLASGAPNKQEKIIVNDKFAPRSSQIAPSGLIDELNVPPYLWKPLGLKK